MKYLIIGNGAAGAYAARAIRQYDAKGEITVLSDEKTPFYSRPRLFEFVRETSSLQDIVIFKSFWYADNRIELILDEAAWKISPGEKTVHTNSGKCYSYDKLLIASGSVPGKIPAAGIDGDCIYTLRTVEDAVVIREKAKTAESIAVIGAGLLGLEAAFSLAKIGHAAVVCIEYFDRLLPRQLDEEGSAFFRQMLTGKGVQFELGAQITSISDLNRKKVIETADGRAVTADFILVCAGIKVPDAVIAGTGIAYNKGIIVNDFLETNLSGIFAAGDCAEHQGRLYGLWTAATDQGRIAGSNMAGEKLEYKGTTPGSILKIAGIELAAIGEIPGQDTPDYHEHKIVNHEDGIFKKFFSSQDILKGAILIGDIGQKEQIRKAIGKSVKEVGLG